MWIKRERKRTEENETEWERIDFPSFSEVILNGYIGKMNKKSKYREFLPQLFETDDLFKDEPGHQSIFGETIWGRFTMGPVERLCVFANQLELHQLWV